MASQPVIPMLLRLPSVCAVIGLSKSQVYRLIRSGDFPAGISLGANTVAWPAEQVRAWVESKVTASVR